MGKMWSGKNGEGHYLFVIDLCEVAAINVPDTTKPGCDITLKSGSIIRMALWDGEDRDRNIQFFLDSLAGK